MRPVKSRTHEDFSVRTVMIAMFLAMVLRGQDQDVSLVIRFAGGANHFKVGEVIPVELSYSASTPGKYSFNTASYDRGGRLCKAVFPACCHWTPSRN